MTPKTNMVGKRYGRNLFEKIEPIEYVTSSSFHFQCELGVRYIELEKVKQVPLYWLEGWHWVTLTRLGFCKKTQYEIFHPTYPRVALLYSLYSTC